MRGCARAGTRVTVPLPTPSFKWLSPGLLARTHMPTRVFVCVFSMCGRHRCCSAYEAKPTLYPSVAAAVEAATTAAPVGVLATKESLARTHRPVCACMLCVRVCAVFAVCVLCACTCAVCVLCVCCVCAVCALCV